MEDDIFQHHQEEEEEPPTPGRSACRGWRDCESMWVDPLMMDCALVGMHPQTRTIGIILWKKKAAETHAQLARPTFLMDEKATSQMILRLQLLLQELRTLPLSSVD